ncbi:MAG TPA: hypothetical protein VHE30_17545 [Polyangiaceae bacterium]|nr:hypothetical protein [Polyangiaceae bacterium]
MSMKSLRAVVISVAVRSSVPALAVSSGLLVSGCLFGSPGPSNVGTGRLYVSGDPSYDQFFSELYQVQLPMGRAADREAQNRARVSSSLGIPADSTADQVADALDQHAMAITKAGVTVKVATSGLDDPKGTPTASLVTTGSGAEANDTALLLALSESIKDAAALIAEVRSMKPSIDRLKPQADALEPGIDTTFRKGGAPKKAEVRKNLVDAQRLIPLMSQRSDDIARLSTDFILKVQKVLGKADSAEAPAPLASPSPSAAAPASTPSAKKPGPATSKPAATTTSGGAAPKPAAPKPEKKPAPSSDEEAPKPAPKPEKKPAADDFEP